MKLKLTLTIVLLGLFMESFSQYPSDYNLGSRNISLVAARHNIPGVNAHAVGSRGERIWDLEEFGGRIYIGLGDWKLQSGAQPIVYYNPSTNSFVNEGYINTDAIENYKRSGDFLFAMHTDEVGGGVGTYHFKTKSDNNWRLGASHSGAMVVISFTFENGSIIQ